MASNWRNADKLGRIVDRRSALSLITTSSDNSAGGVGDVRRQHIATNENTSSRAESRRTSRAVLRQ